MMCALGCSGSGRAWRRHAPHSPILGFVLLSTGILQTCSCQHTFSIKLQHTLIWSCGQGACMRLLGHGRSQYTLASVPFCTLFLTLSMA